MWEKRPTGILRVALDGKGTSPRVWEKRWAGVQAKLTTGNFPARVGETVCSGTANSSSGNFPAHVGDTLPDQRKHVQFSQFSLTRNE